MLLLPNSLTVCVLVAPHADSPPAGHSSPTPRPLAIPIQQNRLPKFFHMDGYTLRCNNLRCRSPIETRAVVTTCRSYPPPAQQDIPNLSTATSSASSVQNLSISPTHLQTTPAAAQHVTPSSLPPTTPSSPSSTPAMTTKPPSFPGSLPARSWRFARGASPSGTTK